MKTTSTRIFTTIAALTMFMVCESFVTAAIITDGLSIHYRADNVDNLGNPGDASTTTLVNLASPGTHNGTIVSGTGVTANTGTASAFAYGVQLTGASQTHIQANSYQIAGGTNKVTDATWEFWLKADSAVTSGIGALYGEFPAASYTRHYLKLTGIGTDTRGVTYDEYLSDGSGSTPSDTQMFDTGVFTQIVVTKSDNTMTFFRDGIQVGATKTNSETYFVNATTSPIYTWFGRRSGSNRSFDGQFNIIRVYDTALTGAQVLGNYSATIPEPSTLALLGLAAVGLLGCRRKRRAA